MRPDFGGIPDQQGFWLSGTERAVEIGVGRWGTCLLDAEGTVRCIGKLESERHEPKPLDLKINLPVKSSTIAVGYAHACALGVDSEVRCWGENGWGQADAQQPGCDKKQAANCQASDYTAPTVAKWASGSTQIGAGDKFTCAVVADHLRCRGSVELDEVVPEDFRLAGGSLGTSPCGSSSSGSLCFLGQRRLIALHAPIVTTNLQLCGTTGQNTVACTALVGGGEAHEHLGLPTAPVELVAGRDYICARESSGRVYCTGAMEFHRDYVGDSRGASRWKGLFQPIAIGKPTEPTRTEAARVKDVISVGGSLCALLLDGTVACWGTAGFGDGSDGGFTEPTVGQLVPGLTGVTELQATSTPCAVNSNGTFCWGRSIERAQARSLDAFEMIGARLQAQCALEKGTLTCIDNAKRKVSVTNVRAVSHGSDHVCAIAGPERIVQCWGNFFNYLEALGDGDGKGESSGPPDPEPRFTSVGAKSAIELVSGSYHACAIDSSNRVTCWGDNTFRQLASACPNSSGCRQPQEHARPVGGLPAVQHLVANQHYTCALTLEKKIWCWGRFVTSVPHVFETTWPKPHLLPALPVQPRALTTAPCLISGTSHLYCLGERGRQWREMKVQRPPLP